MIDNVKLGTATGWQQIDTLNFGSNNQMATVTEGWYGADGQWNKIFPIGITEIWYDITAPENWSAVWAVPGNITNSSWTGTEWFNAGAQTFTFYTNTARWVGVRPTKIKITGITSAGVNYNNIIRSINILDYNETNIIFSFWSDTNLNEVVVPIVPLISNDWYEVNIGNTLETIVKIEIDVPLLPAPPAPTWVSIFDNTYYNATGQGWWSTDPTPHWGSSGAEVILAPTVAFTNRTYTKMRVTFDTAPTLRIIFTGNGGNPQYQTIDDYISGTEVTINADVLTYTGRIYFTNTFDWSDFNITNIEYM
jgi:hypothetical protein